jgi:hypothetical protein
LGIVVDGQLVSQNLDQSRGLLRRGGRAEEVKIGTLPRPADTAAWRLHWTIMQESKADGPRMDYLVDRHVRPISERTTEVFEALARKGGRADGVVPLGARPLPSITFP